MPRHKYSHAMGIKPRSKGASQPVGYSYICSQAYLQTACNHTFLRHGHLRPHKVHSYLTSTNRVHRVAVLKSYPDSAHHDLIGNSPHSSWGQTRCAVSVFEVATAGVYLSDNDPLQRQIPVLDDNAGHVYLGCKLPASIQRRRQSEITAECVDSTHLK